MNPTYGMYSVCAGIQDVQIDKVLLNPDFSVNVRNVLGTVRFDTKMIFLCSPNNPTGNQIPVQEIRYLADRFTGIVVVDEAYIDFATEPSALSLLNDCPNIVVLQTFSKAWGLAGVRLGMAFADPEIIAAMNKVKYPYNINVLSAAKVSEIVKIVGDMKGAQHEKHGKKEKNIKTEGVRADVRLILTERIRLADRLRDLVGVEKIFPSDANFLLVKFNNPKAIYRYLADNGIIVRDRSNQALCEGCLRITVGTPDENDKLITVLKDINIS
jgi:histidinol-phosphate aminotransferase